MVAITTMSSTAYRAVALMLGDAAQAATDAAPVATAADSENPTRDPLDTLDLSDHAKTILARARAEQLVADRLAAQLRPDADGESTTTTAQSADKVSKSFISLAGISEADLTPWQPTVPKVTFTSTLQAFGFSVSATGSADSWSSDIQIRGPNGLQAWDTIWGGGRGMPTAGGGGVSGLKDGQGYLASKDNGKATFTIADIGATATAIATDDASASTGTASFNATTIVVDFTTGNISAQRINLLASAMVAGQR